MASIITVSNLSKVYRIGKKADRADSLVGVLQDSLTAPFRNWRKMQHVGSTHSDSVEELHWALRDISFDVNEGELLGVIGKNGAGKSTLLKILSRITEPTSGEVRIKGRVASLLEVGTGFHPELTGRENVYLNGTILGMHKKEIDRKFDEIVDFSGVAKFLETPIKRYSSGMKVRLAFAVAAHLSAEVLIVDEVLAVGDVDFQKKCLGKMDEISSSGKTVLLVSHNLPQIENLCRKTLHIEKGRVVGFGETTSQIQNYVSSRKLSKPFTVLRDHENRSKGAHQYLRSIRILSNEEETNVIHSSASFSFEIEFQFEERKRKMKLGVVIESQHGVKIAAMSPTFQFPSLLDNPPIAGSVKMTVPNNNLATGRYSINVYVETETHFDAIEGATEICIEADNRFGTGLSIDPSIAYTYQECLWEKAWP
jgi:lipopolysaccharide transport system ATP-binding protein